MCTFADLMALILTFFVLLLSFSTMDVKKYEEMVRSLGAVFGKGTGIILDHSIAIRSPISVTVELPPLGTRETPQNETPEAQEVQDADPPPVETAAAEPTAEPEALQPDPKTHEVAETTIVDDQTSFLPATGPTRAERLIGSLQTQFRQEIEKGLVELETHDDDILVRFRESISFPSGEATIAKSFRDALEIMGNILRDTQGMILVSGHTDDRPIASVRFRSNWELSAARAVSVVHYLVNSSGIPKERMVAQGHADALPMLPNDSDENRGRNRRVEITIRPPSSTK